MSRIDICCTAFRIVTQTVAPILPDFQGIRQCVQYLDSRPHKFIFYPYNYYDGSNFIILTCSGNQVEDYTTKHCLELNQDAYHAIILNRRRSV